MNAGKIVLNLDDQTGIKPGDRLRDDLSAVVQVGNSLWLGSDEGAYLDRVSSRDGQHFANHKRFALDGILELLAEDEGQEIDIEGLDHSGDYLWLVGSHSLKRKSPKEGESSKKNLKRLRTVKREANRYILARIPLVREAASGEFGIGPEAPNPSRPGEMIRRNCWSCMTHRRKAARRGGWGRERTCFLLAKRMGSANRQTPGLQSGRVRTGCPASAWKWRERFAVKLTEGTREKSTEALHSRREGRLRRTET